MTDLEQAMIDYFEPIPAPVYNDPNEKIWERAQREAREREAATAKRKAVLQEERIRKATMIRFFNGKYSFKRVVYVVAAACEVEASDILGPSRVAEHVFARQLVFWFLHTKRNFAKNRIGHLMDRDHTTVMHGLDAVQKRLAEFQPYIDRSEQLFDLYRGDWR